MTTNCYHNMLTSTGSKICWQVTDLVVQLGLLRFWINAYLQDADFNYGIFFFTVCWYLFSMLVHVKYSTGRFKTIYRFLANAGTYIVASALYVIAFGFLLVPLLYLWQVCVPLIVFAYTGICFFELLFIAVNGHQTERNTPQ